MKKLTTEEKLNICVDFIKKLDNCQLYEFKYDGIKFYYASDIDEIKEQIWHILIDITD